MPINLLIALIFMGAIAGFLLCLYDPLNRNVTDYIIYILFGSGISGLFFGLVAGIINMTRWW